MKLGEVAEVRTGAVLTRIRTEDDAVKNSFKLINLKCVTDQGNIVFSNIEEIELPTTLKEEVFAREGDIIVKLSSPYSAAIIGQEEIGCLIPSHFAIIRAQRTKLYPPFLLWFINSDYVKKKILQNNSGSSAFGTISSGFFDSLEIKEISMEKQRLLGDYILLSLKEKMLLEQLLNKKTLYNKYFANEVFEKIKRG